MFHARTLLKALRANCLKLTEKELGVLADLSEEIAKTLKAAK